MRKLTKLIKNKPQPSWVLENRLPDGYERNRMVNSQPAGKRSHKRGQYYWLKNRYEEFVIQQNRQK